VGVGWNERGQGVKELLGVIRGGFRWGPDEREWVETW